MDSEFIEILGRLTANAVPGISDETLQQCELYYQLLVRENRKYNLTSITGPAAVAEKHFLDSLLLLPDLAGYAEPAVVDVGSGAGFPGLPLKICRPDLRLSLLDSVGKKTAFLALVIGALGLQDAQAVHARAEEHAGEYREYYDIAVSRAVAETRVLAELTLPLVRTGGRVVIAKGPGVRAELKDAEKALGLLGGEVEMVREFSLPVSGDKRSSVCIAKVRPTPGKYPRRPGIPAKRPL